MAAATVDPKLSAMEISLPDNRVRGKAVCISLPGEAKLKKTHLRFKATFERLASEDPIMDSGVYRTSRFFGSDAAMADRRVELNHVKRGYVENENLFFHTMRHGSSADRFGEAPAHVSTHNQLMHRKTTTMIIDTKTIRILALALALWSGSTGAIAQSNTASTSALVTDASVDAIVRHNNITYLGGAFQYIGARRPFGAVLDGQTGLPVSSASQPNGPVYAAVSDGNGGWYIGGSFSTVGGTARDHLAHILSDGTLDNAFTVTANNIVYALTLDGSKLYVGGDFTEIGGTNRLRLAAVTITSNPTTPGSVTGTVDATNLDVSINDTGSASVRAIAVSSTEIFVGGRFTRVKTTDRNNIASILKSDGSVNTSWNPNADRAVWTIALSSGSKIFVGGEFTNIGGQTRSQLAELSSTGVALAWNPAPTILSSNPSAETLIRTLAVGNGRLYVGGNFATIAGQSRTRMAAFTLADGEIDPLWTPKADKYVTSMAVSGSTVYAAGSFTFGGSETSPRIRIVALTGNTGAPMNDWVTGSAGTIYAVAPNSTGTRVYAGGDSESIGGSLRNHLAALDASGNLLSFNPQIEGSTAVWALAVDPTSNVLYIGGTFERIAGQNRRNLVAWNIAGSSLESWAPNPDRPVYALALSSQNIYAGGVFTEMSGTTCRRLAAFERSNRVFRSWDPGIIGMRSSTDISGASVRSIAVNGSQVIVGGDFTDVGTEKRYRIAAFTDGAIPALRNDWNPGVNPLDVPNYEDYRNVYAIAVSRDGNTVYVGGDFTLIGGASRTGIAALRADNGSPLTFDVAVMGGPNRFVKSIALSGNTIYLGGKNVYYRDPQYMSVASVDATTGAVNPWNPNQASILSEQANVVAMVGSELMAGGNMSRSIDRNKSHLLSFAVTEVGWIGGNGGSWNVADNWNPGAVPTSSTDVTIASGFPIMDVDHTVASGKNLTISGTGALEIAAGKTLTVAGTANFNGRPVTLRSTSIGTAYIGQVTGTLSGATNVTAERFIKQNTNDGGTGRAWRLVSIPVTGSGTLRDFFMNGRNGQDLTVSTNRDAETANSGTPIVGHNHATASAANTAGFDWIGVANQVSSLRRYVGNATGGTFLSENVPVMTTDYSNADQGYMVFTRGDRKVAFPSPNSSSATTFRSTGALKTGDQTVSVVPSGTSTYTLVGNPYMSVLDLSLLHAHNSAVIKPGFWIWDANIAGTHKQGGYVRVSFNGTSWVTNTGAYTNPERIESGMAFFVEPIDGLSGATNITIKEAHKSAATSAGIVPYGSESSDGHGLFYARLETPASGGVREVVDGVLIDFHKDFKESLGDLGDGEKLRNTISQGALWLSREGRNLVSEGLPWPGVEKRSKTLFMGSVGSQQRILRIDPRGMADRYVKAWLKDRHLNTETEVDMSKGLDYAFTGTGAAATDLERFELVFVEAGRPTTGGTAFEPGTGDEKPSVMLYPNPSGSSDVRLALRSMPKGIYQVQVVDLKGSLLVNSRITHGARNEEYRFLKGRRLPPGRYFVRLIDEKGGVKVLQMASE